ncbi:MAG: hypothetical protein ACU84J_02745 [Gammaproteobacteria bacterium]
MSKMSRLIMEQVEALPKSMQEETLDFVRFLHSKLNRNQELVTGVETNGSSLACVMEKIAERGTAFVDIKDPAEWQRNERMDRSLPGRK